MAEKSFTGISWSQKSQQHGWFRDDETNIPLSQIAQWLKQWRMATPLIGKQAGGLPPTSLRLAVTTHCHTYGTPFEQSLRKSISAALGLPTCADYLAMPPSGSCCRITSDDGEPVFIYHRSNGCATISAVLRYHAATNTTIGYVLQGSEVPWNEIVDGITGSLLLFGHPLLLPILMIEIVSSVIIARFKDTLRKLEDIEARTGFGERNGGSLVFQAITYECADDPKCSKDHRAKQHALKTTEPSRPTHKLEDRLNQDALQELVCDLGHLSTSYACSAGIVECCSEAIEFTLEQLHSTAGEKAFVGLESTTARLIERAKFIQSRLRHIIFYAGLKPRLAAQQQVVFNLLTQTEARNSNTIAKATNADSSVMTLIAILTALFLPATFLSAFFAMPLFEWENEMGHVMSSHFWVFWVISIPLTAVTVILIGLIRYRQNRRSDRDPENGGIWYVKAD